MTPEADRAQRQHSHLGRGRLEALIRRLAAQRDAARLRLEPAMAADLTDRLRSARIALALRETRSEREGAA